MLTKARNENVALRAVLSIPVEFLTRAILCSGLSRSSVLAIIQRLGRAVGSATDKNESFGVLLVSSLLTECDVVQMWSRQDTIRFFLGRITAYLRLYKISFDDPNPFLTMLFDENESSLADATNQHKEKVDAVGKSTEAAASTCPTASILSRLDSYEISPL
jgi:hypothetical protein